MSIVTTRRFSLCAKTDFVSLAPMTSSAFFNNNTTKCIPNAYVIQPKLMLNYAFMAIIEPVKDLKLKFHKERSEKKWAITHTLSSYFDLTSF